MARSRPRSGRARASAGAAPRLKIFWPPTASGAALRSARNPYRYPKMEKARVSRFIMLRSRSGPLIPGDRFGDGELRRVVAVLGVPEHHRIVHVLLQRHVAHHAHGAEALRREQGDLVDRLRRVDPRDDFEREPGP